MSKTARASRCGLILCALVLPAISSLAEPTAQQILTRSEAAMNGARSYQGSWQMNMSMGQMGSMAMNMNIVAIPRKKMKMTMSPAGQPTGAMAMAATMMNMMIVDDGKNMWIYSPSRKMYQKGPSRVATSNVSDVAGFAQASKYASFKLLRTENLHGKPAYVIQVVPKNTPRNAGSQTILMYIDKGTNRFREMRMTGTSRPAPNQPQQTMTMTMVVKNETLNATIPESTFRFTPPPGAKLMQGGMMGGPGMGMPGGMVGPRR